MNDISVAMALVDFIPVVLFFWATIILQKDLYSHMVKGRFALLSAGSIMVLIAGIYKATWKILYALNICDFAILDSVLFPLQAPGFLLVFLSLVIPKLKKSSILAIAPALYDSNLIFLIAQIISCAGVQITLMIRSLKMKKPVAAVMFVLSCVFMLLMGYLGAKFDNSSSMNWIAQAVNSLSQLSLLLGVVVLHKANLAGQKILDD